MNSVIVIISSQTEWTIVRSYLKPQKVGETPYGEWFDGSRPEWNRVLQVRFVQGGLGKISAAGSVQYAINQWNPELVVNLGTCGGFKGFIEKGEIVLVEKTIVYDIIDNMEVADSGIAYYTTHIDLSWLNEEHLGNVRKTLIVSADHDLHPPEIPDLYRKFGAVAGDWESGAIAWVAHINKKKVLILRGVTDLVDEHGGDVYGNDSLYQRAAEEIMKIVIGRLIVFLRKHFEHY